MAGAIEMTDPKRAFSSFADPQDCINAYVDNKCSEAIQHGEQLSDFDIDVLRNLVTDFHHNFSKRLNRNVGVHPDLVNLLNYIYSL